MTFKKIFVYPKYPDNLQHLYELAYNLWTIWNYDALNLFYRIDARLFREVNHNPIKFLYSLTKEKLRALASDKGFLFELEGIWEKFQNYRRYTGDFKELCSEKRNFGQDDTIVYFAMEFGLHESIPIYAGGLGVLSGDFLKGTSDLDLPVMGMGLLYKFGYFTQYIDLQGYQQELFAPFENHLIPVRELHDSKGNWVHVNVRILNDDVKVKLWKIDVGKSQLILLDTDVEENPPNLRNITNELYVADREKRMQQELVLGIGGIRALNAMDINAKVYHFNEGHSAFAVIGRLQDLMQNKKFSFSEAKTIIKASTVFTTHTPVIAGNENFDTYLVKKYLQPTLREINLDFDEIARLAYVNGNTKVFWLPALAIHFSRYVNAVSTRHAQVSRKIWAGIFPERPVVEIPITSVTNGAHMSWISPAFTDLFNRYLGPNYMVRGKKEQLWQNIFDIPDEELWEEHRKNKKDLLNFIRRKFAEQVAVGGYPRVIATNPNQPLNPDCLTIVFARRFATYKRPTLILKDKERFRKILTDAAKPVQIIFAGKAHPADQQSKELIKEVIDYAKKYQLEDRMIFLQDYDINTARHLYWGTDVWLNNPIPDMEACGTSGMKAAMNGVLHLSTLEGWWQEGYNGRNGWAITAGKFYKTEALQDVADANQLYELLEHEVIELYYDRNESDIPETWVRMMKDSIFSVCQNFNTNRMLCDYLTKLYIPSKENSARIAENNYKLLKQAVQEEKEILKYWDNIEITSFSTNIEKKDHFTEADQVEIQCTVQFSGASPELFIVELFYMFDQESSYRILPMKSTQPRNSTMHYTHSLEIEKYGLQSLNVRVKPANEIVQDMHPELIKWND